MNAKEIDQQTLLQNETDPLTHTPVHLLSLDKVGKNYGNIVALSDVTMAVDNGRVTCVLGDNGAGKSTLIKIIAGLHQHDAGVLKIMGEERKFSSPRDALDVGIATVYQDLAVVPLMPIWRNFFLGSELTSRLRPVQEPGCPEDEGHHPRNSPRWASTSAMWSSPSASSPAVNASVSRSPAPSTSARRS